MPRNGSGTFSVSNTFTANTNAQSSEVNANFSDVGSEITNSLPRDGQAGMTGQFKAASGTSAAPGMSFSSDTNSGFFRKEGDTIGISCGGIEVGNISSAGLAIDAISGLSSGTFDKFASGTAMLFAQASAPTGWTIATDNDNAALRLVSGTAGGTGGTTAFTTVFSARTISVGNLPEHEHGSGTLATAIDGAHAHSIARSAGTGSANRVTRGDGTAVTDQSTDTDGAHNHNITGSTGSVGSGTPMDFAVKYVDVNLCTKD